MPYLNANITEAQNTERCQEIEGKIQEFNAKLLELIITNKSIVEEEQEQKKRFIAWSDSKELVAFKKIRVDIEIAMEGIMTELIELCNPNKNHWLMNNENSEKLQKTFHDAKDLKIRFNRPDFLNNCNEKFDNLIKWRENRIRQQERTKQYRKEQAEKDKKEAEEAARKKQQDEAQALEEQLERAKALEIQREQEKAERLQNEQRAAHREEILKPITSIDIDAQYNEKWDPSQSLKKKIKNHAFFQHKDRAQQNRDLKRIIDDSSSKIKKLLERNDDDPTLNRELAMIYKDLSTRLGSSTFVHEDLLTVQLSRNSQLGKVIKGIRKALIQHRADYLKKSIIVNQQMEKIDSKFSEKKEILMELAKILNTDTISDYTEENQHTKNIFEKILGFKPFTNGERSKQLSYLNNAKEQALLEIIHLLNGGGTPRNFEKDVKNIFNKLINTNKILLDDIWEPHEKSRLAVLVAGLQAKIEEQNAKYFEKSHQIEVALPTNPRRIHHHKPTDDWADLKEDVEVLKTTHPAQFWHGILAPKKPKKPKKP